MILLKVLNHNWSLAYIKNVWHNSWGSDGLGVEIIGSQAQSRIQIIRQVWCEEAGLRSSQEVNLLVRFRIRSGNHNSGQTQPSDQQAGP